MERERKGVIKRNIEGFVSSKNKSTAIQFRFICNT